MRPERVEQLFARERQRFESSHPRSRAIHEEAERSLLSGVPMNWMTRWPGSFPIFIESAEGAAVTDVDGNSYVDLCLGDTGAMTGHSPAATVSAAHAQMQRGITTMLPSTDAAAVGDLMRERFGLPHWQFTLSATDANRFVVRLARQITGRPKVMVHNHCYHGSVDETVCMLDPQSGEVVPRVGAVGPADRPEADDARGRVQRRRDARARARRGRRRLPACRAGPDQHRHRPPRPRLPRGDARADPQARHAARHRRDPHALLRNRRLHRRLRARAGRDDDGQADRRRDPDRRLRLHRRRRRARSSRAPSGTPPTSAGSAARSPATRCHSRRCGRR